MTRISTQFHFQALIGNMQDSYEELTRLQNMLQTQKAFQRPSEDPVTTNQAIRIERNINEVKQYKTNVETGSDLLSFSDQILGSMQAEINTAMSKASQGINATHAEGRTAIAAELTSIFNRMVSIGNANLGDKSIFAGRNYLGSAFESVNGDVLFKGDTDSFAVNVFGTESIQANITAEQAFGALSTKLESERNLDARISPLSLSKYVTAGTLVLKEGNNSRTSSLSVTIAANSDIDAVVKTINAAAASTAVAFTNAQTAAQTAYAAAGGTGTLTWTTITPTDSTQMEALAMREAIDLITATVGTNDFEDLTSTQQTIVSATALAARNEFAENEFFAAKTRGGLVIAHKAGNQISVDEASSTTALLHDLELNTQPGNRAAFIYNDALAVTNLAADRTMTFTSASGKTQTVSLYSGDTVALVAQRINRTFNQTSGLDSSFDNIVASIDKSSGTDRLSISSDKFFKVTGVTELDAAPTTAENPNGYAALYGYHQRISSLNNGSGIKTGQFQLETTNPTGYNATVTVRENDSIHFLTDQINQLAGYEASLNTAGTGLNLLDVSRYSVTVTPVTGNDLTIKMERGTENTLTFAGTTFSQMAEEINALNTTDFKIHAEYNGTNLTISCNEKFSLDSDANTALDKTTAQLTTRTDRTTVFQSNVATSLGLSGLLTTATDPTKKAVEGEVKGAIILGQQTRIKDLNNGAGVTLGSLRFIIGSAKTDVDLSKASTLRDVKDLIEAALPDSVTVSLNSSQNGLSIASKSSLSIRLEETGNGLTGRHLGLIPAPSNSVSGTTITGVDLNPLLSGQTLLKDLNAGTGMDTTGFVIRNGYTGTDSTTGNKIPRQTTITFDTNGDGVVDILTVQQLVNHINQKSKQDGVMIEASFDATSGHIKIHSKLASSDLQVTELARSLPTYSSSEISNANTDTITLSDGTNSLALNLVDDAGGTGITGTGLARAKTIVSYINSIAINDTATLAPKFPFFARINDAGNVEIVSSEQLTITSNGTPSAFAMTRETTTFPEIGTSASDLGLLGAFSDSTLLSELNGGAGITPGAMKILWGSKATNDFSVSGIVAPTAAAETITFYNENATLSTTATLSVGDSLATIVTNINTALTTLGVNGIFTASQTDDGASVQIRGTQAFKLLNTTTTSIKYQTLYNDTGELASTASSAVVDLEFARTLGDVKRAVEKATSNAVKVSYGHANRLQFSIASGDSTQLIKFEEINTSGATASSLGLVTRNIIQGRELRDGVSSVLTEATKLSALGFTPNTSAATNSNENKLVFVIDGDAITIDLTSLSTVGEVLNAINRVTATDSGAALGALKLTAQIVDGKYITVKKEGYSDTSYKVLSSGFSRAAEKLGLVNDPTLSSQPVMHSIDLQPVHQARNFFSAVKTLIEQFNMGDAMKENVVSAASVQLEEMLDSHLKARAEAGGRIARFEALKTRFEDTSVQLEDLFGKKTVTDVISTTQKFLQQQQIFEAGLSTVSRVLGLSLFSYL